MILLVRGSRNWNNKTRDNSLTRKVSSSLGSLTVLSFNAVLPFIIRFLTCSSDGDVELVDSTVTWTAGLVRVFVCPGFFDTGTHWLLLALGESCTFFFLSGCSVDSESADRLISNENNNIMWYVLALFNMRLNSKPFYYLFFFLVMDGGLFGESDWGQCVFLLPPIQRYIIHLFPSTLWGFKGESSLQLFVLCLSVHVHI